MSSHDIPRVIIESPYAAPTTEGIRRNLYYAHYCIADSLERGEAPFASHVLYTVALDDADEAQRARGIDAGMAFRHACQRTVVYTDLGVSHGMRLGIVHAKHINHPIEYRSLPPEALEKMEGDIADDSKCGHAPEVTRGDN